MRLATVAVVIAALVGLVPSAGAVEANRLVFTDQHAVYQLLADGSGRESIRELPGSTCDPSSFNTPRPYCPSGPQWSPDGTRIAYTNWNQLYVWDVRNRETQPAPTSVQVGSPFIAWSADGNRVRRAEHRSVGPSRGPAGRGTTADWG